MNKKKSIVFLAIGVLLVFGTGCVKQGPTTPASNLEKETGKIVVDTDNNEKIDIYSSAKDISSTNPLAGEVESILKDACGAVKLTQVLKDPISKSDILVYVWKDKPTTEKLENAFIKNGYTAEILGETIIANKGTTILAISWLEEMDSQEIGVMVGNNTEE